MAIPLDMGCCTDLDLASLGHSRYHGMENPDNWGLSFWVSILCHSVSNN
jgi:hypothetical protein